MNPLREKRRNRTGAFYREWGKTECVHAQAEIQRCSQKKLLFISLPFLYLFLFFVTCTKSNFFPLLHELSHSLASSFKRHSGFFLYLTPISATSRKQQWSVNCPLKAISVWNLAQSYSEKHINTSTLLRLAPQTNSLLSRPPLPLCFLVCVCVHGCAFRYLPQFGMRAL